MKALSAANVLMKCLLTEENLSSCASRLAQPSRCLPSASSALEEPYFLPQLSPTATHNDQALPRSLFVEKIHGI
jgi:hypothetical protein